MATIIAQLSDLHVQVGDGNEVASRRVERAIEFLKAAELRPDAVVLSGDLVNSGAREEHERAMELLAPLFDWGVPILPMVGNHDDRIVLRQLLADAANVVALGSERHLQYSCDIGGERVIVLDTQHTGHPDGKLCDTRYEWLAGQLDAARERPTMLFMHHPPVPIGLPAFDAIALRADHAERLAALVADHPQIELVACGHVHRAFTARIAHAPVFGCPSVFWPARPDFVPGRPIELVDGPIGLGIHVRADAGALASHARLVPPA